MRTAIRSGGVDILAYRLPRLPTRCFFCVKMVMAHHRSRSAMMANGRSVAKMWPSPGMPGATTTELNVNQLEPQDAMYLPRRWPECRRPRARSLGDCRKAATRTHGDHIASPISANTGRLTFTMPSEKPSPNARRPSANRGSRAEQQWNEQPRQNAGRPRLRMRRQHGPTSEITKPRMIIGFR